jgi:hypothetical protein
MILRGRVEGAILPGAAWGSAVQEQRKIVPPVYMLFALLAMIGLHHAIPLAQVVESRLSYLGLVPLVIGITIAAPAARMFDRCRLRFSSGASSRASSACDAGSSSECRWK